MVLRIVGPGAYLLTMTENQDKSARFTIPGSARQAVPYVTEARPVDPAAPVELTVVLRRRPDGAVGADPDDLEAVRTGLEGAGLEIVSTDAASRRIRVRGTAEAVSRFFGTELRQVTYTTADGQALSHRQRTGELSVPAPFGDRVLAVLGIDDRPQARAQSRIAAASDTAISYTPLQIADAYSFPPGTDGSGQSIAIIELGGGFAQSDLDNYFGGLGLATPAVTAVGVDGARNEPGADPQGADGEVLLDIEVAGAVAPGATISVYFAPNTDAGFLDAISEAVHADPTPAAISISWGQNEDDWTAQARTAMDSAFADAV